MFVTIMYNLRHPHEDDNTSYDNRKYEQQIVELFNHKYKLSTWFKPEKLTIYKFQSQINKY